jgi:hypothetical protein
MLILGLELCYLENVIQLAVGERVDDGFHLHSHFDIIVGNTAGDSTEYLVISVVQDSNRVREVILKSNRRVLQLAVSNELPFARNLKPLHIAGKAFVTVGSRREKDLAAIHTARTHDFSFFQVINKIIHFGEGSKTDCSEFLKAVIYLFFVFFTHFLPPKNGDCSIEADSTDIMDKSDLRIFNLHLPRIASQFENDGSDLGTSGRSDRMTLG